MALARIRVPLVGLLRLLLRDSAGESGTEKEPFPVWIGFPPDLIKTHDLDDRLALQIDGDTVLAYYECARIIGEEQIEGDLEYAAIREVHQILDRFICQTWLDRDGIHDQDIAARVKTFIKEHAQPPAEWEVAWEIDHLDVRDAATLSVAGAEFFRMEDRADHWLPREDHPYGQTRANAIGSTFARVVVRAGSKDHALARAAERIDDALDVLRVTLLSDRFCRHDERQQRRGRMRIPRRVNGEGYWESSIIGRPFALSLDTRRAERLQERAGELSYSFTQAAPSRLMTRLSRAVIWIGTSLGRTDPDDSVLDLCTALETLLAEQSDQRKAEAIAARYWLLLLTIGEPSAVTHPLSVYDLYMLRNELVHGSNRRICSREDVDQLRWAAKEAVDRTRALLKQSGDITQHNRLLRRIESQGAIATALKHLEMNFADRKEDAVRNVRALLEDWHTREEPPT